MPASFPALSPEPGTCPACDAPGLQAFYDVPDVPVNSCILMASREEALSYPRGHLRLAHCPSCGFVTSTRFDAGLEYSARYEETQVSLIENLFTARKFADRGGKWVTASRLASDGIEEKLTELGL